MTDRIEDIVLRYSGRGISKIRPYLPENYIAEAAAAILALPRRTVLLTTGFYIPTESGAAETDGPPGIYALARALCQLHFRPVIVTDFFCRGLFEPSVLEVVYLSGQESRGDYRRLLDSIQPVAFLSVERCGHNGHQQYANMRGNNISDETPPVDRLFEMARLEGVLTIGVGDGGNEIGMGNVAGALVHEKVLHDPCIVHSDKLIIATTSNWGAFGLAAALSILSTRSLLLSFRDYMSFLDSIVRKGCVDGISRKPQLTVDGFPPETEKEIFDLLLVRIRDMLGEWAAG